MKGLSLVWVLSCLFKFDFFIREPFYEIELLVTIFEIAGKAPLLCVCFLVFLEMSLSTKGFAAVFHFTKSIKPITIGI